MYSKKNDSENSEKSEPGSQIIIISKSSENRDIKHQQIDDIDPSSNSRLNSDLRHAKSRRTPMKHVPGTPTSYTREHEVCQEGQLCRERIPSRTNSTPNLTTNTRTPSSSFQTSSRRPVTHGTSQSVVEIKRDGEYSDEISPPSKPEEQHEVKPEAANLFGNKCLPAAQGFGVSGMHSRMASFVSTQALNSLDEEVLNNFNMQVGTVSSRVDMWRQRLEDERANSVRSQSCSADAGSSRRSTTSDQAYSFIRNEIQHVIQLTRGLTSSFFGGFTWGLLGIENILIVLLERGSHTVFPVAEILIMNIWRMLKDVLDLHVNESGKTSGTHAAAEAISNAFYAIRSLIHLGKAYRNAHESSDSEYTAEESRSVASSLANLHKKP
jgi:hypothetical protein